MHAELGCVNSYLLKSYLIQNQIDEIVERQCFSTFSSRGTFETLLIISRNLDTQNSANLRILKEPSRELPEPVGSAEPSWKILSFK